LDSKGEPPVESPAAAATNGSAGASKDPEPHELVKLFDEHRPQIKWWLDAVRSALQDFAPPDVQRVIHSIGARLKAPGHLQSKILRKRKEGASITAANFFEKVEDLAGVRVITLYRWDFKAVDEFIRCKGPWVVLSGPIAYAGCEADEQNLEAAGFVPVPRQSKYTSIHYIVAPSGGGEPWMRCEVQVRGLHLEGWAEVDHQILYPERTPGPFTRSILGALHEATVVTDWLAEFARHAEKVENDLQHAVNKAARTHDELNATKAELAESREEFAKLQKQLADRPELQPAFSQATGILERSSGILEKYTSLFGSPVTITEGPTTYITRSGLLDPNSIVTRSHQVDPNSIITGSDPAWRIGASVVSMMAQPMDRCEKCGASQPVSIVASPYPTCARCKKMFCFPCFGGVSWAAATNECAQCQSILRP
jgi:ppGpp synthetase/RelA/SpoT-type nucleotidyltranferase